MIILIECLKRCIDLKGIWPFFYSLYVGTLKTNRAKKSTKEIGDMGFGGEELFLGGRLFPIIENLTENNFKVHHRDLSKKVKFFFLKITGLRIDIHNQSSITSKTCVLDLNFINHFYDLDQLKSKDDHISGSDLLIHSRYR
jgi:hypothetical protein